MVKQFILLLQLIGVFIYQILFNGDVTVSQVVPSSIPSQTPQKIEITVNKGDVIGFAKIQQDIPSGFAIEPIETQGATFSYKDNRIKFIWMALPIEEQFTVSYTIKPLENTKGDFKLEGKFSYISNSERKNIEIPEASFTITDEESVEEIVSTEETPKVVVPEEISTSSEEPITTPILVSGTRKIEDNKEGNYTVKLTLNKKGVIGFAKVTEYIPVGFEASELDSRGGVFSFKDNEMKVLWMSVPKDESITLSYTLKSISANNGAYNVSGEFAYLENDETQQYEIAATTIDLNVDDVVAEATNNNNESGVNPSDSVTENQLVNEKSVDNTSEKEEPIASIPSPETGVSYKVQVGAGHKRVADDWFVTTFNFKEEINTENHEGWIKYVVGSFNEYKTARDKRNVVRNKIKRAFVTAYNSGERITVQEALMISKQKWYK